MNTNFGRIETIKQRDKGYPPKDTQVFVRRTPSFTALRTHRRLQHHIGPESSARSEPQVAIAASLFVVAEMGEGCTGDRKWIES